MSENKTESKSIPEIMDSLDYVLGKLEELDAIAGAVNESTHGQHLPLS